MYQSINIYIYIYVYINTHDVYQCISRGKISFGLYGMLLRFSRKRIGAASYVPGGDPLPLLLVLFVQVAATVWGGAEKFVL